MRVQNAALALPRLSALVLAVALGATAPHMVKLLMATTASAIRDQPLPDGPVLVPPAETGSRPDCW